MGNFILYALQHRENKCDRMFFALKADGIALGNKPCLYHALV